MTPDQKKWIDEASYRDLLYRWRFAKSGDSIFQDDEASDHYIKVMAEAKEKVNHVAVSKEIGWDNNE